MSSRAAEAPRERVFVGATGDPLFARLVNANREELERRGYEIRTSESVIEGKAFIDGGPGRGQGIVDLDEGVALVLNHD